MTEWREIQGHEDYMVSDDGRVAAILKCHKRKGKIIYKTVAFRATIDGIRKNVCRYVHRLVCEAFHGSPPFPGAIVRHFDGDSMNNHKDNLRWGSHADNSVDARRLGRQPENERHGRAVLTNDEAREIRQSPTVSPTKLAEKFGVSKANIHMIKSKKTWRNLDVC